MTYIIALAIFALLGIIIVQIGRVSELAAKIRGEEEVAQSNNDKTAFWLVVFMIVFLIACVYSAYYYKNQMLGYGPLKAASEHGVEVDSMFNVTLFFTGIIFVITHILLFWYPYKYRQQDGNKARFFPHNTSLEIVWTGVPLVVMTFLVVQGLIVWNRVMPDVKPGDEYVEIEATAYQYAWDIRYPGPDNGLGTRDFRLTDLAFNPLGIDFSDDKSVDDVVLSGSDHIILPVDTTIRVRIIARDVLHNFYLPHFRVKMDAIPGLPTYFIFKPTKTTEEFRRELRRYPEWRELYDPIDPDSKQKWEEFHFELACAELCGQGHYSMRRIVEIVTKEEFEDWKLSQKSYYKTSIRNTDSDPRKGELLKYEIDDRKLELRDMFGTALSQDAGTSDRLIRLNHVFYKEGSDMLDEKSRFELDEIVKFLNENERVIIELLGHTDHTGDPAANIELSKKRADNVKEYLVSKGIEARRISSNGYGSTRPVESNDTVEGRNANRRTELRIVSI
ncbi:MAG TPA: OmpA family protein [Saprospiraceae bacterium]|nr:OmpA family protein [Saprospiraceae bacterium]